MGIEGVSWNETSEQWTQHICPGIAQRLPRYYWEFIWWCNHLSVSSRFGFCLHTRAHIIQTTQDLLQVFYLLCTVCFTQKEGKLNIIGTVSCGFHCFTTGRFKANQVCESPGWLCHSGVDPTVQRLSVDISCNLKSSECSTWWALLLCICRCHDWTPTAALIWVHSATPLSFSLMHSYPHAPLCDGGLNYNRDLLECRPVTEEGMLFALGGGVSLTHTHTRACAWWNSWSRNSRDHPIGNSN